VPFIRPQKAGSQRPVAQRQMFGFYFTVFRVGITTGGLQLGVEIAFARHQ
jgi:hypothetical protein